MVVDSATNQCPFGQRTATDNIISIIIPLQMESVICSTIVHGQGVIFAFVDLIELATQARCIFCVLNVKCMHGNPACVRSN